MDESDSNNNEKYCICGLPIELDEFTCGKVSCKVDLEEHINKLELFFTTLDEDPIKAFSLFENFNSGVQAAILLELPDDIFWGYLQDLGEEKVLDIFRLPNIEFRKRFLEILRPKVRDTIEQELKNLSEGKKEDYEEYLLYIISLVIHLVEKS